MHVHAHIAAACITIIRPFTHTMYRLPFGSKAAPQEWCVGFEIYIDLVNKLLVSPDWDRSNLPIPDLAHTPATQRQPLSPGGYSAAQPLAVTVSSPAFATSNGFIDN